MIRVASPVSFRGIRVDPNDPTLDQLAKLIPGESVAAFLAMRNFLGDSADLMWMAVLAGLILCVFFRGLMSVDNGKWNVPLLSISVIAYAIWVWNILTGSFTGDPWQAAAYFSLLIFTYIGPTLYKQMGGTGRK